MKILDAKTMQDLDRVTTERYGVSGLQLMENGGRGVAEVVKRVLAASMDRRVTVVTGKGNNGGDGYVTARHLKNSGCGVTVFSLAPVEELNGDAALNAQAWIKMGGEVRTIKSEEDVKACASSFRHSTVIVDAIFGIGLSSPVKGLAAKVIELMNGADKKVVAVDVPSGIDATTGAVLGCAVRASVTATMALPKIGLYTYPGREYAGRVEIVDIGLPAQLLTDRRIRCNLLTSEDVRGFLRPRPRDTHKSACGHLLVVAGSPGKTGAAYMTAMGAMRAGAGLVTLGLPRGLNAVMEAKTTEVMTEPLPESGDGSFDESSFEAIQRIAEGKTAIAVGPGLGKSNGAHKLMERMLREIEAPFVIDADGLNAFIGRLHIIKDSKHPRVLTPHPGEAARLLPASTSEIQDDRIEAASAIAAMSGAVVVLKGASTVIATPKGEIYINPTGNPGLATAGTGDVLAGMIGGLMVQGYPPIEAACIAVYAHGLAADKIKEARGEAGMIATDLLPAIPEVLNTLIER